MNTVRTITFDCGSMPDSDSKFFILVEDQKWIFDLDQISRRSHRRMRRAVRLLKRGRISAEELKKLDIELLVETINPRQKFEFAMMLGMHCLAKDYEFLGAFLEEWRTCCHICVILSAGVKR